MLRETSMSGWSGRVAIIYLVYGDRDIGRNVARLRAIADDMFDAHDVSVVVVDNTNSEGRGWVDGCFVVEGDNRYHEFSGWERGYAIACKEYKLTNDDQILFANDTFSRHAQKGYLDPLNRKLVQSASTWPCSIGYCDDLPRDAQLLGLTHRWWFRSNIFIHPKQLVDRLMPLCCPVDERDVFDDDPIKFWSDTDLISENWKAYVKCWLFDSRDHRFPEYRLRWHKSEPLNASNRSYFRTKAMCILSEHYMGARLNDLEAPILDFNIHERLADRHLGNYHKQFLEVGVGVV